MRILWILLAGLVLLPVGCFAVSRPWSLEAPEVVAGECRGEYYASQLAPALEQLPSALPKADPDTGPGGGIENAILWGGKSPENQALLRQRLPASSGETQIWIAATLGFGGDPLGRPLLEAALEREELSPHGRSLAAHALGQLGVRASLEQILALKERFPLGHTHHHLDSGIALLQPSTEALLRAAEGDPSGLDFGRSGPPVFPNQEHLYARDRFDEEANAVKVRMAALFLLARRTEVPVEERLGYLIRALEAEIAKPTPGAGRQRYDMHGNTFGRWPPRTSAVRLSLVEMLASLGEDGRPGLRAQLRSTEPTARPYLSLALAWQGDREGTVRAIELLEGAEDAQLRIAAARTLGEGRLPEAVPPLRAALRDPMIEGCSFVLAEAAAEALRLSCHQVGLYRSGLQEAWYSRDLECFLRGFRTIYI